MNEIVIGSLAQVARDTHKSIAEIFLNIDAVILVDTSGSMEAHDSRDGQSRYDTACQELIRLQAELPGKVAVLAFSGQVEFCPSGIPHFFGGGTNMAKALALARVADLPGIHFILISDGEPDSKSETLAEARRYKNRIDTIFTGPEGGPGMKFLQELAQVSGGQAHQDFKVNLLSEQIKGLLA